METLLCTYTLEEEADRFFLTNQLVHFENAILLHTFIELRVIICSKQFGEGKVIKK
ncbi:MAG: hypothetical protein XU11_C0012G0048 [Candidatus Dadabacteria bacterium CSP1-2]|nr:MAG: hypothetical protein XU11_C0012G0048 [Candidatus Dadabacteria bacterium CSP1-2]